MKKYLLSAALLLSSLQPALAQDYQWQSTPQNAAQPQSYAQATQQAQDPLAQNIAYMQHEWAKIKYQMPDHDKQLEAIHALEERAEQISSNFPQSPEVKIWEGIILSTDAGIVKGISALGKVKKAKTLFEQALQINPNALDGSAYTSLGSLYYQVPGWPIGFGDDEKAEKNLKTALQINPNGIDPNFFYGDYLIEEDRYDEAKFYLERALQAAPRPDRPLADAGRRQEIKAKLSEIVQK
jgi:tetratricopeptide (TPR) repeat protein